MSSWLTPPGVSVRAALLSAVTALSCLVVAECAAAQRGIAPDLAAQMRTVGDAVELPVLIVMTEQADRRVLLPAARALAPAARRAFATRELELQAERTQAAVRDFLSNEVESGRASGVRPLWIANGIRARLTPPAIDALLAFAEIRTVLWDPPIPAHQANDSGESIAGESGRRAATPSTSSVVAEIWQLESVQAPAAWALGYEGAGIVIAIQDSDGVWNDHPDLRTHLWNNDDEIADNGIDDDQNGYIDDTWGWDFFNDDNDPNAAGDHGTKCAGIAAGNGASGTRTGVAPKALIMSCRVNSWGENAEGIQYAIDNGAHIISMSRSQKWRFAPKPDYDWWRAIADGELAAGVFHANSIGNEGDALATDPIPFNIAAPGSCPAPWAHPDQVQAGLSGINACGAIAEDDVIDDESSLGPSAWEDIAASWPEYPFDMRLEYQDYPFSGGLPGIIKPDIVAPGPNTLSTALGGGYATFNGTSAATPHVAGAMALVLSAHPFVSPAEVTMILQSTAMDLGAPGKDNTYGAGKLDCLAAVELARGMNDFGTISGTITEAGTLAPLADIAVTAGGTPYATSSDAAGDYFFGLPAGPHVVDFSSFYHEDHAQPVVVDSAAAITLDVELVPVPTSSVLGTITELGSGTAVAQADVRVEATPVPVVESNASGKYEIDGIPVGQYALSVDAFGYEGASAGIDIVEETRATADLALVPAVLALDMEIDPGWQGGIPGDTATTGAWERVDPNGTAAQPEDDHSKAPGVACWVTEQGAVGGDLGAADVDDGETTLRTAVMDLSLAVDPAISYWAWYSNDQGSFVDDEWVVQISENGGTSWIDVVRTNDSTPGWQRFDHRVLDHVTQTHEVVVQFIASDYGTGSIVEAAIDDFQVLGTTPTTGLSPAATPQAGRLVLAQNHPNPFNPTTTIDFELVDASPVRLRVFDTHGRLVRTLLDVARLESGVHVADWDGRDASGQAVASGVYYYRLESNEAIASRRMVLLK